ncbi:hypothetical protein OEZ86_007995 [Tetradesmus obliquus]|nr:hypothetical protein OEZ86_007995 [Tetradesmus obliquus]
MKVDTKCIHSGEPEPRIHGAAVMPIFQTATFAFTGAEVGYDGVRYTRCNNNPSQEVVAAKLAALEGTEAALVLGSGMSAIASTLLTLLKAGDHMLIQRAAYGGTYDLVHHQLKDLGISATMIDIAAAADSWQPLLQPNTKVIYVEAISNPLMEVPDLSAVVAFAKRHKLTSVIDATFATPINLQPAVDPGFDVVIHSATKFLNGHSDLIAGVVAGSAEMVNQIKSKANHLGGSLDPHGAFLLHRGVKTLALRVERQNANALMLAAALEQHPQVAAVFYPGLRSAPRYQLVRELFINGGAGGMLAFEPVGGIEAAETVLKNLKLGMVAPSLGGVETLVTRPSTTTHVGLTREQREAIGIGEGLIRVAVGIEDGQDLVDDFMQALDVAAAAAAAKPAAT